MRFIAKLFLILIVCAALVWLGGVLKDKNVLQDSIIRFHVVANSDSEADQSNKLAVRDAVVKYLQDKMEQLPTVEDARKYITENLGKIEQIAKDTLQRLGADNAVKVSIDLEEFGTRVYDTFTLPAGVYEALKIEIGEAMGKNWWCVVFPSFCMPKTTAQFESAAVSSGFEQRVTNTISNSSGYKVRFFVLDLFGKLENLFS